MSPEDSLKTLAAFENEEAKKKQEELPRLTQRVWRAVTNGVATYSSPAKSWSRLFPKRQRAFFWLIAIAPVVVAVGIIAFVWLSPAANSALEEAIRRLRLESQPYLDRARALLVSVGNDPNTTTSSASTTDVKPVTPQETTEENRDPKFGSPIRPRVARAKGKAKAKAKRKGRVRSLTSKTIVLTVRKRSHTVMPCLKRARAAGEIAPGRHTFVLHWTILPNGLLKDLRMTGPSYALRTSLPACLAEKMGFWRFPPTREPSSVKNFPLPITVR